MHTLHPTSPSCHFPKVMPTPPVEPATTRQEQPGSWDELEPGSIPKAVTEGRGFVLGQKLATFPHRRGHVVGWPQPLNPKAELCCTRAVRATGFPSMTTEACTWQWFGHQTQDPLAEPSPPASHDPPKVCHRSPLSANRGRG